MSSRTTLEIQVSIQIYIKTFKGPSEWRLPASYPPLSTYPFCMEPICLNVLYHSKEFDILYVYIYNLEGKIWNFF